MKYYQQGDVILIPTTKVEGDKIGRVVQEGEHTGHAHRLDNNGTVFQKGDRKFVLVQGGKALLTHEEHNTQEIEEGAYEVRIIREVDIFSKLVRAVVD